MTIRMTGLISGLDTDSIIQGLLEAQTAQNKKTTDKKTEIEWTQEIWTDLNQDLIDFTQDTVYNLKLQKNYLGRTTTVSDDTKLSVTAGVTTPVGAHEISIQQLASSQYVTSAEITDSSFSTSTLLTSLGFTADESVINISTNDSEVQLSVASDTTVNDFLTACTNAGLNASYDTTQNRFFISSGSSGEDNSFTITTGTYTSEGITLKDGITSLVDMSDSTTESTVNEALVSLQGTDDTSSVETSLIDLAVDKVDSDAEDKANAFYLAVATKTITDAGLDSDTMSEIEADYADITDDTERQAAIDAAVEEKIASLAAEEVETTEYQDKIDDAIQNGIDSDLVASELGSEVDASTYTFEDKTTRTVSAQSAMETAISDYKTFYEGGGSGQTASDSSSSPLANLGLGEITDSSSDLSSTDTGSYTLVAAKNSIITYNGAELENSSNTVSVNGLTLNLTGVTSDPITITVSQDTDSTYDMIKDFVSEYNDILQQMNDLYYADSASDYEPLSDDEKDEMSDTEIEKWETKIKDSLLRRDNTIGSITNAMKSALLTSVTVDGKSYTLSSFGIGTSSDYTEKGLLHIDGDSDDSSVADETNELQEALESDPDLVMQVITGIAKNLSTTLTDKMKKTSLSSSQCFYNDVDYSNQITDLTEQISEEASDLSDMEDKYYEQFAAMETALAELQSTQNTLSSLFGTSSS